MSRLSGSPFRKPSPFEFPLGPPSPPETNTDTIISSGHILPPPQTFATHDFAGMDAGIQSANPDVHLRGKRTSSIPYHSTTVRDPKERSFQRTIRSLVIVIPPSTLIQEHGQPGTTPSNGPYHRLSQGVVMPLFPSIFGQLTAIAKEFSFPSTVGLCLYFHYVDGGLTMKPRISDESWQSLWAHVSDPVGPNERKPAISGKVEFDIDLRLARWYPNWVTSIHKEFPAHAGHSAHPSILASLTHFRAESSLLGGRTSEDDIGENSILHQRNTSIGRHVPRKLSLVERFDTTSVKSDSKPNSYSVAVSTEVVSASQTLSTILQEDEPKSGREQLDNRVKSWRASALISPTPLATQGQTSLDPSNLPNNVPISTALDVPGSPSGETEEMNLEDFTWSVSSAGPQSCGQISPMSWAHAPSVHLAQRIQGSVCTSPSMCTSFGPDDEDAHSYASSSSRIASVHLADRLQGSVCTSPSTCTSFGPDDDEIIYYIPTFSRIPTPDIASRHFEDCPPTPMSSTSWGAPSSYPPSPKCYSPSPSLDLGERSVFCDASDITSTEDGSGKPWMHVWPYISLTSASATGTPSESSPDDFWGIGYPYFSIYRPMYPHLIIYPTLPGEALSRIQPTDKTNDEVSVVDVELPVAYPTMEIYRAIYPYNLDTIYPAVMELREEQEITSPQGEYPFFNIYPAVSGPSFAYFSLYTYNSRSQYPDFDIYPSISINYDSSQPIGTMTSQGVSELNVSIEGYPFLNIKATIYPPFEISLSTGFKETRLASTPYSSAYDHGDSLGTIRQGIYPFFNLYPAVYPHFNLYPGCSCSYGVVHIETEADDKVEGFSLSPWLPPAYPSFNLYPSVYPHIDIYPAPYKLTVETTWESDSVSLSPALPSLYPAFNLYPSVYPYLTIYPTSYIVEVDSVQDEDNVKGLRSIVTMGYPYFTLYPVLYPYFDIYPSPYFGASIEPSDSGSSARDASGLDPSYPFFNLYPAVYPHFDLYIPHPVTSLERPTKRSKPKSRLTHLELHAMVMMEKAALEGSPPDFRPHDLQIPSAHHGSDGNGKISHFMQETAAANAARNIRITTSAPVPIPSRDPRRTIAVHSSGSAISHSNPTKGQRIPLPARKTISPQPPIVSRSSSHREPAIKPPIPPKQFPTGPSRRDSLVLQRVNAFDLSETSITLGSDIPSSTSFTRI